MNSFGLPGTPLKDYWVFTGNSVTAGGSWLTWMKPQGKSHCSIFVLGGGGGGGTGVIGANSAAAGGGGGSSGSQTYFPSVPLAFLPNCIYISVGFPQAGAGRATYVSASTDTDNRNIIAMANGGNVGGNASGATPGTFGSASAANANTDMIFLGGFGGICTAGISGLAGNTNSSSADSALPANGAKCAGGTGGAGLGAAGSSGSNAGSYFAYPAPSPFCGISGGKGSATVTVPPGNGSSGLILYAAGLLFYAGTGGASTHGTATGAGLVQAAGGDGSFGCGGGGMGGALTGSTPAVQSKGGAGIVIITVW